MTSQIGKVGLALGGGAARGIAHIGALSALEENGIPVDMVVGTSIGAIIGAVYAAGTDLERLQKFVLNLNWDQLADLTVPRLGFLKVEKLSQLVEVLCKRKNIEDLELTYRAIAVDIQNGEQVAISTGSAAKAAMASSAIPGVFLPQKWQGRLLVDGGIRTQVPVEPTRDLGADLVIAVDVSGSVLEMKVNSVIDIIFQTVEIMQYEANAGKISQADILIRPDLTSIGPFDLRSADQALEAGRKAVEAKIPEICAALERIGRRPEKRRFADEKGTLGDELDSVCGSLP